jgi:hypothetical protein
MKPAFLLPLVAALAACATAPLTLNDNLVVPGERIGEVEIGMPLAQLVMLKGMPLRTVPIQGTEASTYLFDGGLTVAAHDEVYWIVASDPRFRTATGVAPGAEQIYARASYGRPSCVVNKTDATVYEYPGFYFDVANETGKVTQVGVRRKSKTCKGE